MKKIFALPRLGIINTALIVLTVIAIYGHAPAQAYHKAVNQKYSLVDDPKQIEMVLDDWLKTHPPVNHKGKNNARKGRINRK